MRLWGNLCGGDSGFKKGDRVVVKIWVIYMAIGGISIPAHDEHRFTNESACQMYIHMHYGNAIREAFGVMCVNVTPTMCQGQVCE
jgi:hypothetical protein